MRRPEQFSCQSAASILMSILTLVVKRMILWSFSKRRSSYFYRRGSIFITLVKLNLYLGAWDIPGYLAEYPISYSQKWVPSIMQIFDRMSKETRSLDKMSTNLKPCSFWSNKMVRIYQFLQFPLIETEILYLFPHLPNSNNNTILAGSSLKVKDVLSYQTEVQKLVNWSLYQQNRLQFRAQVMGLQCAKPIEQRMSAPYDSREKTFQAQMRKIKEIACFPIKINNLRLLNFPKSFQNIKITLPHVFAFSVPARDFHYQDNAHLSSKTYHEEFETSIQSISDKFVQFWLEEKGGRMIQVLRLKVHQLFRGPVKHDHLIRQLKGRLLFDFHIDQYLLSDFILSNCEVQWSDPSQHTDYTYYLSLMIGNSCSPIQASKVFEKHEKIKEVALTNVKIRSSEMRDAIVRIRIVDNATSENVLEEFLPVSKLQQQNGYKTIMKHQVAYEFREIWVLKDVCGHDQILGEVQLHLKNIRSKLYAEQMDCVILSQDGIVMHTLTENPTRGSEKSQKLTLATILKYTDKLQLVKDSGINEYGFYSLMEEIFLQVQDKRFTITDQLFTSQESLLNFLLLLSDFLEPEDQTNNEYIWETINHLSKEPILTLKYFCGIKSEQEKIIFAKKFYMFIVNVVKKIIKFTINGLTYKQFVCIHKFMAFAYFRLPWCQDEIIQVLRREGDPTISEQKMAQIGASYALKSPSKCFFYDWQSSVLRLVKKDEKYMNLIKQLDQAKQINPSWAKLLFDRDYEQIFYSIFSQLWDEAENFLNNNGKILWQYFPRYGELLEIFFGQINNSKILDFSPLMTKCNMKLIKNQKLLTSFMMLIFPKTHLFQTNCVIKCLSLIQCYFNAVLNDHKLLPNNFNYNYFYTGVKSILDSEHSYLLQKVLAIIYKFYNIFTKQFKDDLKKLIINKVFYKLFLHWSQDVRSIFHLLLIFRIYEKDNQQNPELSSRRVRHSECIQTKLSYEHMITALVNPRYFSRQKSKHKAETPIRSEFYQKMRAKMTERGRLSVDSPFTTEKQEFSDSVILRKCSYMEKAPSLSKRKWSVAEESQQLEGVQPTESQLKYTVAALKEFQLAKSEPKPDQKVDKRSKLFQLDQDE